MDGIPPHPPVIRPFPFERERIVYRYINQTSAKMAIKYFQNMLNTLKNSVITSWPANVEKGVFTPFTVTGLSKTLDVIIVYAAIIKFV